MKKHSPSNGLGTLVRRLLDLLDGELEGVYRRAGLDWRPKYTPILRTLMEQGPCTVGRLASAARVSQPAASQTIREMTARGYLESAPAADGRVRLIAIAAPARRIIPELERQWASTARAAGGLEAELTTPLRGLLKEAIAALEERPFPVRIAEAAERSRIDV